MLKGIHINTVILHKGTNHVDGGSIDRSLEVSQCIRKINRVYFGGYSLQGLFLFIETGHGHKCSDILYFHAKKTTLGHLHEI